MIDLSVSKLSPEVIQQILTTALSNGGHFAEIFTESKLTTLITLHEDKIKSVNQGIDKGVGIRVLFGEQTGYAYSESMELKDLLEAAKTAASISKLTGKLILPHAIGPSNSFSIELGDRPSEHALQEKIELLYRANESAKTESKKIFQATVGFMDEQKWVHVVNSDGLSNESKQDLYLMYVNTIATDRNNRESATEFFGGRRPFHDILTFTPEKVGKESAAQAVRKLKSKPAPAGNFPVIINHGWGGVMVHEAVGHGLEGDFNRKGTSIYSGKVGEKVASEKVTIVDDGTIINGRGTLAMDDEGHPTRRNVLIENGILKGYMQDSLNSTLMKTEKTGNGRRQSYKHIPMPRMTNTFIDAGTDDPTSMIKSVKKGVFAKSLGGGQVDIVNGNFVFQVNEGYMIENGKITHPIKGANLIGNGPDAMKKVVGVGNDLYIETATGMCGKDGQSVMVSVGQPTVLISDLTVGGTKI